MNITNVNQILTKDTFSYFKINAVGFPTGYDAINLPDGMTIYKPDGYIYGTPIKKQTKSSVILAKNQEETIYKIIQVEVVDNAPISLNVPDIVNNSNLKITGIRFNSGDNITLNLNNLLSGYYTSNTGNQIISTSKSGSFFSSINTNVKNKVNFYANLNASNYIELNQYVTGSSGVSIGTNHALAFFNDGKITGWGSNTNGQALNGNSLTGVIGVAAGENHSLALLANRRVTGWGLNTSSQAFGGNDLTGVIGIAAGGNHSLALLANARVTGWGLNTSNQAFGGNNLTGVIGISAGQNHSLALLANARVTGWGDNTYGQITGGNNLTGVIKISSHSNTNVAILQSKEVTNWGEGNIKKLCVSVDQTNPNCNSVDLNCSSQNKYQAVVGVDSLGCPTYACVPCPPENTPICQNNLELNGYDSLGCPIYKCAACPPEIAIIDPNAVDFISFEGGGTVAIEFKPLNNWAPNFPKISWGDLPPALVPATTLPTNLYGTKNPWIASYTYPDIIVSLLSSNRTIIDYDPVTGCPIYANNYIFRVNLDNSRTVVLSNLFPTYLVTSGDQVIFQVKGNIGASASSNALPIDTGYWPAGVILRLVVPSVKGAGCNPYEGVVAGRGGGFCGNGNPYGYATNAILIRNGVNLVIENHGIVAGGGRPGPDDGCCCGEGGGGAGIPGGANNGGGGKNTCCGGESPGTILCGGAGSPKGGGTGGGLNSGAGPIVIEGNGTYSFAAESTRPYFG